MFKFLNFASRLTNHIPRNVALGSIICGMGVWVGIRCFLDALQKNEFSFIANSGFFVLLIWRGWVAIKDTDVRQHELFILPFALIWTTWMAHRGIDFFQWWLPLIVLAVFIASFELIFPILYAIVILVAIMLALSEQFSRVLEFFGATSIIAASVAIYRRSKDISEKQLQTSIRKLQIAQNAAETWHIELGPNNEIEYLSSFLSDNLVAPTRLEKLVLFDIFHPGDYLVIDKARLNATRLSAGEIDATAACDCRLIRRIEKILWVRVQFVRVGAASTEFIIVLKSIDERLQMEDSLRENQRKLASQAIEISAQYDAAKSALHARQEVERLAQHDLRSPLKSIESAAALLRKGRLLSNTEEHLLTSIERTAARALSMVTMSLDLYRMEEGTFRFNPETIDLVVVGRSVIGEFINHARSKNVHLDFNASMNTLKATGNSLLTTSIVENLVRNALEAAPEHSTVTMALYQGARVGLLIHNEGVVHESIRKEFFEKYATHGKRGGLGLGTYSARLIARAQGGDLTMTTSTERGTLLMLKLNREKTDLKKDQNNRPNLNSFGPSLPANLVDVQFSPASDSKLTPIELLVVEDDDYNWMLLLSWLPSHVGARRAINGREAIEALTLRRPDIVIMDLEMPIMNGFEALTRIREMQSSASEESSIIYAFTGYDDTETMEKIKVSGFDGVLAKPVSQKNFEEILRMISFKIESRKVKNNIWIEKSFIEAFPTFIESRRMLVNDIERSLRSGDITGMKRAAHTLAGSPAIHGFQEGIDICKEISEVNGAEDLSHVGGLISTLRKILSNPVIR
jgi:signal transduction histidine kinase/CheY-like chemotaxis protein